MTGSGHHLVLVLLAPVVLCLVGAAAAALWRRWFVAWACLAPAWILAGLQVGLFDLRDELDGPVLVLCRVDPVGIAVTVVALPVTAALAGWFGAGKDGVGWSPARFALMQSCAAGLGILPLPVMVPLIAIARPRWVRRSIGLGAASAGALACLILWRSQGVVDVVCAAALVSLAVTLRAARVWAVVSLALGVVALTRAFG